MKENQMDCIKSYYVMPVVHFYHVRTHLEHGICPDLFDLSWLEKVKHSGCNNLWDSCSGCNNIYSGCKNMSFQHKRC